MARTTPRAECDRIAMPYSALGSLYDDLAHHDYVNWSGYIVSLLEQAGIVGGSRVIDAACGTGGIAMELAQAGYQVLGMDISAPMLSQAAEKAGRTGHHVTFVQQDITAMRVHRPMDAVLCACDGVNYLTADGALNGFFQSARRSLKKGGMLLFDISTEEKLRAMAGQLYGEDDEDYAYLWFNELEEDGKVLVMDITLFTKAQGEAFRRQREQHRQRLWSRAQVEQALLAADYRLEGVYEAFTTTPPKPGCDRIQFVAVAT